jgi:hypothetical protein
MNRDDEFNGRSRAMAVAAVVLASVWLVNWPRFPLYNASIVLALTATFLACAQRLKLMKLSNWAVILPLFAVYAFYVVPLIMSPGEGTIGLLLPEWLEGWDYIEATCFGALVVAGFAYAYTWGAIRSRSTLSSTLATPIDDAASSACGLIGAGGLSLALIGAWMLREYFAAVFASTDLFNVRWVLHEGEAGIGRWRMLVDFAGPSGVLIGVYAASKRPKVAGTIVAITSLLSVIVAAPLLGRLVLIFAGMGPVIGYLYAKRREISLGTLLLLLFASLPVLFAYTALFRGFEASTGEALFERIMYSDLGRVYAAFYLPYASSFEPSISYGLMDLKQFQVALLGSSFGGDQVTSTEAFSTLVTGGPSSHVLPGFLGSFFMTFGVLWGSVVAIFLGFLLGRLVGVLITRQGGAWELAGLLLSIFVSRNWIPHSNSYLVPIAYVYAPLLLGLACVAVLSPRRSLVGMRGGGSASPHAG